MTAFPASHPALLALIHQPLPHLSRALLVVVQWDLRRRTRKDLRGLPDYMLRDIGLDPYTAAVEAAKPFWRG